MHSSTLPQEPSNHAKANSESTIALLQFAAGKAQSYVRSINERAVAPSAADLNNLARFHEKFPEGPTDPADVIELLNEAGAPATMASTGNRYFGYVIGGALPASIAANWLADVWDQNAAFRAMSPIAAEIEEVVLPWVADALGLPPNLEAGLVTCATAANFTAMVAARHALLKRAGWNLEEDGMFGAPEIDVVVGAEVHASMMKALTMAGFGKKRLKIVEADSQGRMRVDRLPPLNSNTIVCVQAGNVNSGSFDPFAAVCAKAREAGAWVHVDGAFGLWAAASPRYRHLLEGIDQLDSWGTDAHKWANVNYECGIVFVRDTQALRAAMTMSAAYLQPGARREPMYQTPDCSRRPRGLELWAALKSLGRSGLADLIERTCAHAQTFAQGLRDAGFEILNDVVINQVLVHFGDDRRTNEVIRRVQEDGTCWCSGTVWHNRAAMRISVSSWATTASDVQQSLEAILRVAKQTASGHASRGR